MAKLGCDSVQQFPSGEHLRAIANAAIRAADVIGKSIITDDLMSSVRSEADENHHAFNEVLNKLQSLFDVEPPDLGGYIKRLESESRSKRFTVLRAVPSGWRHEITVPFWSLWRTFAGLLVYRGLMPLSLVCWDVNNGKAKRREEANVESPPIATAEIGADGRYRRTDDGLPTEWLGRLRQHAVELLAALPTKASEASGQGDRANGRRLKKNIRTRPTVADELQAKPFYDPDLKILVAMSEWNAHDQDSRKSSSRIGEKMSPTKTALELKDGLSRLLDGGHVKSLSHGNQGGYWLTAKGRKKLPSAKAKRKRS